MEANPFISSDSPRLDRPLYVYRLFMAGSGAVYLIWWLTVKILLPDAFNPLGSRLATVFYCWLVLVLSFGIPAIASHIATAFGSCLWVVTLHYFYLFDFNEADINWVVGSYITVVAASACFQTQRGFLSYSAFVVVLSSLTVFFEPPLRQSVFLPGIITILLFAYIGLRSRLYLLKRSVEASARFQSLFDSVFEGVLLHEKGHIIEANESFAAMFGFSRAEVKGMHVTDFVRPEDHGFINEQIRATPDDAYEVYAEKKDGSRLWVEVRGKNHLFGGRILRLVTVRDLTARKKNEQDRILYESSLNTIRMRDEFLSIASHELKTPLTAIKIQTQMAARQLKKGDLSFLTPEKAGRYFEQTDRQTNRLSRLIEEMLDVSHIATGKMSLEIEEFDMTVLVNEVVEEFRDIESGQEYLLDLPPSLIVRGDRFRIEQVVSNLVSNALKYGQGKPVKIFIKNDNKELRLSFQDQGIGIAPEHHDRIFLRFERAVSSNKISGLGLGLYIADKIIGAHGGKFELVSTVGEGSCFTMVLPMGS